MAPACGQTLENAVKLDTSFPAAILTTMIPLLETKSLTDNSSFDKLTVNNTAVFPPPGGFPLSDPDPSSLEQACIIQATQVKAKPPVSLFKKSILSMLLDFMNSKTNTRLNLFNYS